MSTLPEAMADELDTLVRAIEFSDARRFSLHLVVCSTSTLAATLVHRLAEHFAPARLWSADFSGQVRTPTGRQHLVREMTAVFGGDLDHDTRVHIVDLSRARPSEQPDWSDVFTALNLSRSQIIDAHAQPIILVIPAWMEALASRTAPDLMSVVSGFGHRFELSSDLPPATTALRRTSDPPLDDLRRLAHDARVALAAAMATPDPVLREQHATRALTLTDAWRTVAPRDIDARLAYADACHMLGSFKLASGDLPAARGFAESSLRALRGVGEDSPGPLKADLARRGAALADLLGLSGEDAAALDVAEQAMRDAEKSNDGRARLCAGTTLMKRYARAKDFTRAQHLYVELVRDAQALGVEAQRVLDEAARSSQAAP